VRALGLAVVGPVAAVLVLALVLAGCGTGGMAAAGNTANGKQLFVSKCGYCHALADAGSNGTTGPSLDAAFGAVREKGARDDQRFRESTIQEVVLDQIKFAIPPMPSNLVRGQDAADVAAYVASVAGIQGPTVAAPAATKSTKGDVIFKSNCSTCHTLAAANAKGTVGPNLDQLKPPLNVVRNQVINGGGAMPAFKGRLSDQQIQAVAKYVTDNAGKK
jgi:cbb3-type cytochrome c oxidase subunit III